MPSIQDGPESSLFRPLKLKGNVRLADLAGAGVSRQMSEAIAHAPSGRCVFWGIPFDVNRAVLASDRAVWLKMEPLKTPWLVFLHTSDVRPIDSDERGMISPMRGEGRLNEHAADYVIVYADGFEARLPIRRRHHVGPVQRGWGDNCFEAVPQYKPRPLANELDDELKVGAWGQAQTRAAMPDLGPWINWLWAWENPQPGKPITGLRVEPVSGAMLLSAVSAGNVASNPLRWQPRRKAVLGLPKGETFDHALDQHGGLRQIRLDLGQVISATPQPAYPNASWSNTANNYVPQISGRNVLVEYAAHPDARFHLPGGRRVPVAKLEREHEAGPLEVVEPATQRVTLKAVEKISGKTVAAKLHVHGEAGEYMAPVDRHRIPNHGWFQDYSVDFAHLGIHRCTYVAGETTIDLPLGRVYVEVSKGFEIRPVRKTIRVSRAMREIVIELEKVLPWREKGWVTADTHVHFLSPPSALLEGAGEGVNVVNLLASQWGELITNAGDFDGKTTLGARDAGGDGEYLVRVGTENRQHVLGHISLLGYSGRIIAPMTTGGPDESALGDPVETLLTEWARQCRKQGGLVVVPHFPNPRCEHAATIIEGDADAIEMTSWGNLYGGIDPYSLSDWYRYLNCGYLVPAVGGTDKMSASTSVGAIRTYARIEHGREFTYQAWMDAVRSARTFVTYGPLLEFSVDGRPAGSRIEMNNGGTLDVTWQVASVTVPISRVELIVNGEVRESKAVRPDADEGNWSVKLDRSSWLALLVRGHYPDKPEVVAAHSSPVMVQVAGSQFVAAADAVTILEQIEGALAFIDTTGTRAEAKACKRMRLVLVSAHRRLHNRMHEHGCYHQHTSAMSHRGHGR